MRTDVRHAAECRRAVDETTELLRSPGYPVQQRRSLLPQTTLDCSEEEWDLQIDINLKGTFLMSKFACPDDRAGRRSHHQQ